MNGKLASVFITLLVICNICSSQGQAPSLNGSWTVTEVSIDGKSAPKEFVATLQVAIRFDGEKYTVSAKGMDVEAGTVKIDAAKTPAQVDIAASKGADAGKTQRGIFKVEGDMLTIAVGKDGKDRPTDFKGGAGVELSIFKKAK